MNDQHFKNIYRYIAGTSTAVFLYVFLVTFIPIPKESQRFVDIALAFLLGWLSSNIQYLTGGNPAGRKDQKTTIENTPDGTTVTTEAPGMPLEIKPKIDEEQI